MDFRATSVDGIGRSGERVDAVDQDRRVRDDGQRYPQPVILDAQEGLPRKPEGCGGECEVDKDGLIPWRS